MPEFLIHVQDCWDGCYSFQWFLTFCASIVDLWSCSILVVSISHIPKFYMFLPTFYISTNFCTNYLDVRYCVLIFFFFGVYDRYHVFRLLVLIYQWKHKILLWLEYYVISLVFVKKEILQLCSNQKKNKNVQYIIN